jgi:hypothetical protein
MRAVDPAGLRQAVCEAAEERAADAEAICEAAQRPSMRFVPVKTEQQEANGIVFLAPGASAHAVRQCVARAPV